MANIDNTILHQEEWEITLQEELDEPVKWKDICDVRITNTKVIHHDYADDITVQTGLRNTSYTLQPYTIVDDQLNINQMGVAPQYIARADFAQSTFTKQMDMAKRQAVILNETVESAVYGDFANFTSLDNSSLLGGGAGSITVSATNVDDIVTGVVREIGEAAGESMLRRHGGFMVWRHADLELLQKFAMANGFSTADQALQSHAKGFGGWRYMGLDHYASNLIVGGRIMGGVKNSVTVGILKATRGFVMVDDKDPAQLPGLSIVSYVDYGIKTFNRPANIVFDIAVA